jgi:hypothetical protein
VDQQPHDFQSPMAENGSCCDKFCLPMNATIGWEKRENRCIKCGLCLIWEIIANLMTYSSTISLLNFYSNLV